MKGRDRHPSHAFAPWFVGCWLDDACQACGVPYFLAADACPGTPQPPLLDFGPAPRRVPLRHRLRVACGRRVAFFIVDAEDQGGS